MHPLPTLPLGLAPPPAPAPTWTGLYIGVHGGGAWQSAPNWSAVDPNFRPGAIGFAPQTLSANPGFGRVGGIQAGYNYQFSSAWVVGLEGDISWASLGDNRTVRGPNGISGINTPIALSMSENTEWLASVRGKLGFVGWGKGLYFVTGGAAWRNTEYNANWTDVNPAGVNFGHNFDMASTTTKGGWVLGGGAEYQVTPNILMRGEYLYYGFNGSFSQQVMKLGVDGLPRAAAPLPATFTWNSYNVQVARVAVSYKF
jgi:outer membrane immunogenic protein